MVAKNIVYSVYIDVTIVALYQTQFWPQEEQWQDVFGPAAVGAQDPAPHVHLPQQGQQDPADREQHRH